MATRGKQQQSRGLASFFSCCYKENDQPEITYCHDNITTMTALEPTLPMPPLQELDSMFTELVVRTQPGFVFVFLTPFFMDPALFNVSCYISLFQDELDLTEEHRVAMFALPAEKKWQIYCSKKMVRKLHSRCI